MGLEAGAVSGFLTVGNGADVELDREARLAWMTECADVSMAPTSCWLKRDTHDRSGAGVLQVHG